MKGGGAINYEEPFTDKEKISLLSAFMIFDLKRLLIGNKPLNSTTAWFVFSVSSLVIGFVERLRELIDDEFPIPISDIRHAQQPLFAVSNGLYQAAALSQK